jgi:hypothetical protein
MKWTVLFLVAFFCPANAVMAEEAALVEKSSLNLRIYNLMPGSSFNPGYWQKDQTGFETLNNGTRKNSGFRITAIARFDNADRIWGKVIHSQVRLSYQNFRAETDFWKFRHTDSGPAEQSFFTNEIRHDSISLQPFIGTDIVTGDDWSLRIFSTVVPSLNIEKNNDTYNISTSMSLFAEFCLWNIALEAGYGFRMPMTLHEDKNLTVDNGWYFGAGYKVWNF